MKNWIIVLLIFVIPLGVFIYLESNTNKSIAKEAASAVDLATADIEKSPITKMNSKPRMLKFFSPMCSDCKKISKEMTNIPSDYKDIVVFEEINVSDGTKASNEAVKTYNITVVPTLVFVSKNGEVIQKTEGFLTEKEIRTSLNNIK